MVKNWPLVILLSLSTCHQVPAFARDDGRFANSPLKSWFDSLRSGRGLCCSVADGIPLGDGDWESKDGGYRVKISGEWYDVPDDAVLKQPNLYGHTMVWTYLINNKLTVRCFIPGAMI